MIPEVEREVQIYRLRDMLSQADRIVWSKDGFPNEHRPDVGHLSPRIQIATHLPPLDWHSGMRQEVLDHFHQADSDMLGFSNKIAWYDFSTREIRFNPVLALGPDEEVRRVVFHEAATDISNRAVNISPDQYSDDEKDRVNGVLQVAFPEGEIPTIERSSLIKTGFNKYILVDGKYVSLFYPHEIEILDEIYPTVHEMVTDQVLRRGGDIDYFDNDARNGQIRVIGSDHQQFARVLFEALRFIDWRDLLSAFRFGDYYEALAILEKRVNQPDFGAGILLQLFKAMQSDEEHIDMLNRMTGRSFADFQ